MSTNENGRQHITWAMFWGFVILFVAALGSLFMMKSAQGEDIATLKERTESQGISIIKIETYMKSMDEKMTELLIRVGQPKISTQSVDISSKQ